ncbi:hypothetical protein ACFVWN_00930 [Nocardiopsis flavescens]|uniref:hypothetical protein n=1 Tax=Nocardiopsis flavescens TaxID=758803 RepID=UPI0036521FF9
MTALVPTRLLPTYTPAPYGLALTGPFLHTTHALALPTALTSQAATVLNATVRAGADHGACDDTAEILGMLDGQDPDHRTHWAESGPDQAALVGGPTGGPFTTLLHAPWDTAADLAQELARAFALGQRAAVLAPACWDCGAIPGALCAYECGLPLPRLPKSGLPATLA